MFTTIALSTLTLAKAYGLYMIVVGLTGVTDPTRWRAILEDFQRSPGLTYATAIVVFILGLVLTSIHNIWTDPLAIIISLFGWLVLVEGVLLLAVPKGLMQLGAAAVASPGRSRLYALLTIILGALLLVAGVLGRADVTL